MNAQDGQQMHFIRTHMTFLLLSYTYVTHNLHALFIRDQLIFCPNNYFLPQMVEDRKMRPFLLPPNLPTEVMAMLENPGATSAIKVSKALDPLDVYCVLKLIIAS
jgi:hypothetical protein